MTARVVTAEPGYGRVRWVEWLTCGLVLNAIALCVSHYLSFRSLWLDEAFVAINLRFRSLSDLFAPLEYSQTFPRLYLALIWLTKDAFGYELWTLRLLPLVFGVAAVLLWTVLLHREFSAPDDVSLGLCAVLLFLTNPVVYYYAAELKPYSLDLFFSGYAVWYARRLLRPAVPGKPLRWAALSVGWLFPLVLSLTYGFVLAAVGVVEFWPWLRAFRRPFDAGRAGKLAILIVVGSAFIALSYAVDLQHSRDPQYLSTWTDSFVGGTTFGGWMRSAASASTDILGSWWIMLWWQVPITLLAFLGALGCVARSWNERRLAAAGGILLVELLAASSLGRYPTIGVERLELFFFPFAVAMIVEGLRTLRDSRSQIARRVAQALVVLLVLCLLWQLPLVSASFYRLSSPGDINPSLARLDRREAHVVVPAIDLFVLLRAAPHLPAGFSFVFLRPGKVLPVLRRRANGRAAPFFGSFYFLTVDTPVDRFADELERQFPGRYRRETLTPHLSLFRRLPPEETR